MIQRISVSAPKSDTFPGSNSSEGRASFAGVAWKNPIISDRSVFQ